MLNCWTSGDSPAGSYPANLSVAATSARLFAGSEALWPPSGVIISSASGHARWSAHALSIGHDFTREYLKAFCRDLAVNYPMSGLQLESFGWMEARHGHHHERYLVELTSLEHSLLSICFNPDRESCAKHG